ncbi:cytosolic 5'-nucleotidase 1A [Pygocentrus nattereri]|uniref:Cytosolic 5'-nucleotidase 1A n=1 Tax=Pygocentrus nattereri TaxID=42514 RepID=A0A3B4EN69_PYGNA|nr:cytosolic 5'-nucleotidase 1A [Pygocentrus nattereri]
MDPDVQESAETQQSGSALVTAVSCHDIFDLSACQTDSSPLAKGAAFSFINAVQAVNQRLVKHNANEMLRFEVILLGKDCEEQIKSKIFDSAKHYGLKIGKFYFCSRGEFVRTLQANNAKLFLSTDRDDVYGALKAGVPAALLCQQADQQVQEQLKVLFSGDLIGLSEDVIDGLKDFGFSAVQIQNFKAAKGCIQEFAALIGEMRKRFGCKDSPLQTILITVLGSRDVCATALKTLRGWGLDVDEAFCLAGAPRNPILTTIQPHILWDDGLHNMKGVLPLMDMSS